MTNDTFQTRLDDLAQQISTLPTAERARLMAMVEETGERRARAHAATAELGDAIGSLRLTAQYLAFDLEATRREKALLQAALDSKID
jgi:chromosome segregation ATPase